MYSAYVYAAALIYTRQHLEPALLYNFTLNGNQRVVSMYRHAEHQTKRESLVDNLPAPLQSPCMSGVSAGARVATSTSRIKQASAQKQLKLVIDRNSQPSKSSLTTVASRESTLLPESPLPVAVSQSDFGLGHLFKESAKTPATTPLVGIGDLKKHRSAPSPLIKNYPEGSDITTGDQGPVSPLIEISPEASNITAEGHQIPTVVEALDDENTKSAHADCVENHGICYAMAWISYRDEYQRHKLKIQMLEYLTDRCSQPKDVPTYAEKDGIAINEKCDGMEIQMCDITSGKPTHPGLSFLAGMPLSMSLSILSYYCHVLKKPLQVHINIGGPTTFIMSNYFENGRYGPLMNHISICHQDEDIFRPPSYETLHKRLDSAFEMQPAKHRKCIQLMLEALNSPMERQPDFRLHLEVELAEAARALLVLACVAEAAAPSLVDMERLIEAHQSSLVVPERVGGRSPGFAPLLLKQCLLSMMMDGTTFKEIFGRRKGLFCFARNCGAYTGRAIIVGRPHGKNVPLSLIIKLNHLFGQAEVAMRILKRDRRIFNELLTQFNLIPAPQTSVTCISCESLDSG